MAKIIWGDGSPPKKHIQETDGERLFRGSDTCFVFGLKVSSLKCQFWQYRQLKEQAWKKTARL